MPDWFEAMKTPEWVAFIVALVGALISVVSLRANVLMTRANVGMEKATKRSVDVAEQANALTAQSLQDQVDANRKSRSASIQIIDAKYGGIARDVESPSTYYDDDAGIIFGKGLTGFVKFSIINQGVVPAFGVQVYPTDFLERDEVSLRRIFDGEDSVFASNPFKDFRVIQPAEIEHCTIAIRNIDGTGQRRSELRLQLNVSHSDGNGSQLTTFDLAFFGTQSEWQTSGIVFERFKPIEPASSELLKRWRTDREGHD